jgi:hypothetical protein
VTTGRARNSQIIYSEWNLPPQAGIVTRLADEFEFSMRPTGYLIYPFGPRTRDCTRLPDHGDNELAQLE